MAVLFGKQGKSKYKNPTRFYSVHSKIHLIKFINNRQKFVQCMSSQFGLGLATDSFPRTFLWRRFFTS